MALVSMLKILIIYLKISFRPMRRLVESTMELGLGFRSVSDLLN